MDAPDQRAVMDAAIEAGHILLENGAEIFRVDETMRRISRHYGVEDSSFFVLTNGIFASGGEMPDRRDSGFARVLHIPARTTQLDRVVAVNQLSREVEQGLYTLPQLRQRLREIRSMPHYPVWMQVVSAGLGSAAFCYMFGGSWLDSAEAMVVGLLMYLFMVNVGFPHMSRMIGTICGSGLATLLCLAGHLLLPGGQLGSMVIGSIMPLIPGVSFTNGIRDIADGDYLSGTVRLLDATLTFMCLGIGVGVVVIVYHHLTGGALL